MSNDSITVSGKGVSFSTLYAKNFNERSTPLTVDDDNNDTTVQQIEQQYAIFFNGLKKDNSGFIKSAHHWMDENKQQLDINSNDGMPRLIELKTHQQSDVSQDDDGFPLSIDLEYDEKFNATATLNCKNEIVTIVNNGNNYDIRNVASKDDDKIEKKNGMTLMEMIKFETDDGIKKLIVFDEELKGYDYIAIAEALHMRNKIYEYIKQNMNAHLSEYYDSEITNELKLCIRKSRDVNMNSIQNLECSDIMLVASQTNCTIFKSILYLLANNQDIVNAIMDLTVE